MSFHPAHEMQALPPNNGGRRLAASLLVLFAHGLLFLLLAGVARQVIVAPSHIAPLVMAALEKNPTSIAAPAPPTLHPLRVAPMTAEAPQVIIQPEPQATIDPAPKAAPATSTLASAMAMAPSGSGGSGTKAGAATGKPGAVAAAGSGGGNGVYDLSAYLARVARHIERHLIVPIPESLANWRHDLSGTVLVHLVFRPDGSVQLAEIARSSGIPMFDEAALAAVRRADPLPVFPPEVKLDRINGIIPVSFSVTATMRPTCAGPGREADLAAGKCLLR